MWNSAGIFYAILYIVIILTGMGLLFSTCLDEIRLEKSRTEKNKKFLQRNQTKKLMLVAVCLVMWAFIGVEVSTRDNLHKVGVSDNKCIELAKEYDLGEREVRDYITFTLNNGKTLDESLDFLKGGR